MSRIIFFSLFLLIAFSATSQTSTKKSAFNIDEERFQQALQTDKPIAGTVKKIGDDWSITDEQQQIEKESALKKIIFRGADFKVLSEQAMKYVMKNGEDCYTYLVEKDDGIWCISIFGCQ